MGDVVRIFFVKCAGRRAESFAAVGIVDGGFTVEIGFPEHLVGPVAGGVVVPVAFFVHYVVGAEEDAVFELEDEVADGGGTLFGDGADHPFGGAGVEDVVRIFFEAPGEQVEGFQRAAHVSAQVQAVGIFFEHAFERGELGFEGAEGSVGVDAFAEKPGFGVADVGHEVIAERVGVGGDGLDAGIVEGDLPAAAGTGGGVEFDELCAELGEGFNAVVPVGEEFLAGDGHVDFPGGDGDEVELPGEFFVEGGGIFEGGHGVELCDAVGAGGFDEDC